MGDLVDDQRERGGPPRDLVGGERADGGEGDQAVQRGDHAEADQDREGDVAPRVLDLLTGRGDRVEADVGEERDGGAGGDPGDALGGERRQVPGPEGAEADRAEQHQDRELEDGHRGGRAGALPDAADEQQRGEQHHDHRREVDDAAVTGRVGERGGQLPADRAAEEFVEVLPPADGDRRDRDAVFEQQTPADEEGGALAEGGVGVGVRAARDRDGAAQLGEGEGGENAGGGRQDEGDQNGGAGLGDGVGQADEDAGAHDGADAEAHELEEPHAALEAVAFEVRAGFGDEEVGGLDAQSGRAWEGRAHGWFSLWWCDARGGVGHTRIGVRTGGSEPRERLDGNRRNCMIAR